MHDARAVSLIDLMDAKVYDLSIATQSGEEVLWTDPHTGVTFLVDQRTGNSYPVKNQDDEDVKGVSSVSSRRTLAPRPSTAQMNLNLDSRALAQEETPSWIHAALGVRILFHLSAAQFLRLSLIPGEYHIHCSNGRAICSQHFPLFVLHK